MAGCELFSDLDRFTQAEPDEHDAAMRDAAQPPQRDAATDARMPSGDAGDAGDAGAADAGGPDLSCRNPQTFCLRIEAFLPHVDELVSVDLVTIADNILRARAMIEPLGGTTADFVLPLAIPEAEVPAAGDPHPLHVEIFADQNKDGMYTPGGDDHEWNIVLPASGNLVFPHNSTFTSIDPRPRDIGADFHMSFTGMTAHLGQQLEVMVIEVSSKRAVGLYRIPALTSPNFEVTIPGIIDPDGVVYRVEFYADLNMNRSYDDPDADHTWVIPFVEAGPNGVSTSFAHGTNFEELDYQFSFEE
jgi:hypothetical protein